MKHNARGDTGSEATVFARVRAEFVARKEVLSVPDQSVAISSVGYLIMGRIGICQVSDPTTKSSEMLLTIEDRAIKC